MKTRYAPYETPGIIRGKFVRGKKARGTALNPGGTCSDDEAAALVGS
jgi:hypothetical protein